MATMDSTGTYGVFYTRPKFRNGMITDGGWYISNVHTATKASRAYDSEEAAIVDLELVAAQTEAAKAARLAKIEAQEAADAAAYEASQRPLRSTRGGYTTKRGSVYGEGRVYDDMPGATHYDNGNGKFSIQIWDN